MPVRVGGAASHPGLPLHYPGADIYALGHSTELKDGTA
jgi:hypothetical protein